MNLPNALYAQCDVTDVVKLKESILNAESVYGPAACLVNNAGLMLLGEVAFQDPKEWNDMINVNMTGILNGIHCVMEGMIERKTGTVINVSSIAGRKTFPNHVVYCGTKFAVHAISENLREEVSKHNVRVITIAPGAVETELLSHTTSDSIKTGYEEWKMKIGGAISPENVADAILYAFQQPQSVCIREIVIAATKQEP